MARRVELIGLEGFPLVKPGDDLGRLIVEVARANGVEIEDGDVVVVSQKVVSKAEGRIVDLRSVRVSREAELLAAMSGKDPALAQVILDEAEEVVKVGRGRIIVRTRQGVVCANAGVDRSNVAGRPDVVSLLPENPDESAARIRERVRELTGRDVAVVITDTYGRPLRRGQVNFAIGLSGLRPFRDYRGTLDLFGYRLRVKRIAVADEVASAAELVMGSGAEGVPVAIIKGLKSELGEGSARELNMPEERWLFR